MQPSHPSTNIQFTSHKHEPRDILDLRTHTYAHTHMQTCKHTHIHTYKHTHTYTQTHAHTQRTHVHTYTHAHIHIRTHIHIHIHTHTRIHTYTHARTYTTYTRTPTKAGKCGGGCGLRGVDECVNESKVGILPNTDSGAHATRNQSAQPKRPVSCGSCIHGCMGVWVYGCMGVWL